MVAPTDGRTPFAGPPQPARTAGNARQIEKSARHCRAGAGFAFLENDMPTTTYAHFRDVPEAVWRWPPGW